MPILYMPEASTATIRTEQPDGLTVGLLTGGPNGTADDPGRNLPVHDGRHSRSRSQYAGLWPETQVTDVGQIDPLAWPTFSCDVGLAPVRSALEDYFAELGKPAGLYSTADGRATGYAFWKRFGDAGARWLIRRLDRPVNIEKAWGVTNVLSALGPAAVDPIIWALTTHVTDETADVLLSALAGMDPSRVAPWSGPIREVVQVYLRHADDAVRGKAVNATGVLAREPAIALLTEALAHETDGGVRELIDDEIASRD